MGNKHLIFIVLLAFVFAIPKKESTLFILVVFGSRDMVVKSLINNAKKKGARILYISGMGTD